MDQALIQQAVEVITLLGKGVISAGVVTALTWLSLEWLLFPIKRIQSLGEIPKRYLTLALGIGFLFLAHYSGVVNFGNGPRGWGAATFFGFVSGGLAPRFHDYIKAKVPVLTNG